jgi:uncharacterized membrane protein YgcG
MKLFAGIIFILIFIFTFHAAYAQDMRNFPPLQGLVTDATGTLSPDEIDMITLALEQARGTNTMDGHVYIALSTEEWYLDEYVKDYADYLQAQGQISPTGWLLYISIADRKFSLAVQDRASETITDDSRKEIYLILEEKLKQDDIAGGIMDTVHAIGNISNHGPAQERKNFSPGMLMFMGIAVIVTVMMLRLRKAQRQSTD